jgi:hypothetical protein
VRLFLDTSVLLAASMSLIRRLFRRKDARSILDPVFGHLTYDHGVWTHVPKSREEGFMVTVAAPASGPSHAHRLLLERVGQTLPTLEQKAREFIRNVGLSESDVTRLSVYSLEMGTEAETQSGRFVLELSDADASVIHRVSFRDGAPAHYTHDD